MKRIIIYLIALVYLTTMSCKQDSGSATHDHEHDHNNELSAHAHNQEENKDSDHIHEHEQSKEIEIDKHDHDYKTAKIALQQFNFIIKTSGEIQPATTSEIMLIAANAGIVHYADNRLTEGALVKQGEIIFNISGGNLVDNNINIKYNQVRSAFDKAKSDFERAEQLVQKNIISEKEFEHLKMIYTNAKSEYDIVQKSADANGSVLAPERLYIKEFYVEEGQYVEAGEKLACVIAKSKLHLVAKVSQKYLNDLPDIKSATFLLTGESDLFDTETLNGKLLSYGKAIPADSYYLPVTFEIDYDKNLIPGSFAKIYLKSKKTENCIVVPKSALIEEQGNYFVFVEEGHDQFHKHAVQLGRDDGENVVITEGIRENDVIVIEGAYHVKLASMSSALPAHNHSH